MQITVSLTDTSDPSGDTVTDPETLEVIDGRDAFDVAAEYADERGSKDEKFYLVRTLERGRA